MTLSITRLPAGPLETNAYLVVDAESHDAIIVDAPPESLALLQEAAAAQEAKVTQLVITHGHWDHIGDTAAIAESFGVPVLAHAGVVNRITHPADVPVEIAPWRVDTLIGEGDTVSVGGFTFSVMHLPGHDEGHIALVNEAEHVFLGGDVLFPGGHGRTDIPGSDQAVMERSLVRLLDLPDPVVVYNGHGLPTSIGAERPWMSRLA